MTTPTLAEIIRTAIENRLADVHIKLPGRVERYDPKTQKVDVTPLIERFQQDENGGAIVEAYPMIKNVPVAFPRVGKFSITFPVAKGDNVTINFCESSIETYQLGGGRETVSPDLFQRFDLTDAIVTPGWYPDGKALESTDLENIVIGMDGLTPEFVALANLVLDELNVAKANAKAAVDYATGIIVAIAAGIAVVGDGGTGLQLSQAGFMPTAPTLTDPSSVAAEKVKAT